MRLCLLLLVALLVSLPGCAQQPIVTAEWAAELSELAYPEDAPIGPELDIVVVREDQRIRIVNRTPRRFENMLLWLNQQYVRPVEAIEIGTDNVLALPTFINQYQEPFPVGGFLSPETRREVVLAELYDPRANQRYPLVARPVDESAIW